MNAADVRFVDGNPDLHAREVLGDEKQAGGVEAGNDRFADGHAAINDDAFDRGSDGAIIQRALGLKRGGGLDGRGPGLLERGFVQRDVGFGDFVIGFVRIVGGRRQRFGRPQFLRPVPIRFGLGQLGLHLFQIGLRAHFARLVLVQLRLGQGDVGGIKAVVNFRQNRSFLDHRAVINGLAAFVLAEKDDLSRHLGADIDDFLRFQSSRGGDGDVQIAPFDGGLPEGGFMGGMGTPLPRAPSGYKNQDGGGRQRNFEGSSHFQFTSSPWPAAMVEPAMDGDKGPLGSCPSHCLLDAAAGGIIQANVDLPPAAAHPDVSSAAKDPAAAKPQGPAVRGPNPDAWSPNPGGAVPIIVSGCVNVIRPWRRRGDLCGRRRRGHRGRHGSARRRFLRDPGGGACAGPGPGAGA